MPKRVLTSSIVCEVEDAFDQSKASEKLVVKTRIQIIGILSKHSHLSMNLSPFERKALKQLKENKDIVYLPADKGRRTVVMDASDYESKMLTFMGMKNV